MAFDVTPTYERLEEDFEIYDDIVLPEGGVYEFTEYEIQASSADHRMIAVGGNLSTGSFFSGHRTEYSAEIGFRPRRGIALMLEAEHNVLDLAEGVSTPTSSA